MPLTVARQRRRYASQPVPVSGKVGRRQYGAMVS
jgi:hypothetical protein